MGVRVCLLTLFSCFLVVNTKVFKRCELARELLEVHEIPKAQLATWVCIANYESLYNTSAHNSGSGYHGLFQINELFWCSPPGNGLACGVSCADLKDDDIEDDVICARRIFRQHQRLTGDGFNAWVVYKQHCNSKEHADSFLRGCFQDSKNATKLEKAGAVSKNDLNSNGDDAPKESVQVKRSGGGTSKAPITVLILSEGPRPAVARQKKAKSFKKSGLLEEMAADLIPIATVSKYTNFKPMIHLMS